jgi:hypothetical protein
VFATRFIGDEARSGQMSESRGSIDVRSESRGSIDVRSESGTIDVTSKSNLVRRLAAVAP